MEREESSVGNGLKPFRTGVQSSEIQNQMLQKNMVLGRGEWKRMMLS